MVELSWSEPQLGKYSQTPFVDPQLASFVLLTHAPNDVYDSIATLCCHPIVILSSRRPDNFFCSLCHQRAFPSRSTPLDPNPMDASEKSETTGVDNRSQKRAGSLVAMRMDAHARMHVCEMGDRQRGRGRKRCDSCSESEERERADSTSFALSLLHSDGVTLILATRLLQPRVDTNVRAPLPTRSDRENGSESVWSKNRQTRKRNERQVMKSIRRAITLRAVPARSSIESRTLRHFATRPATNFDHAKNPTTTFWRREPFPTRPGRKG